MAAWVKGQEVGLDAAVSAAAALLSSARAPIVAGLNAELSAVRAAFRLAAETGASVDTLGSEGTYAELGALSRGGAMTTTPAETIGRADTVLAVGAAARSAPLIDALRASRPSRGVAAGAERTLLTLDTAGDPAVAVATLRAYAKGHLAGEHPSADIARALFAARFGVILYDPAELGEFGIEMLQALGRDLNESTRVFTLSLGSGSQDRAVVPLSAWTTGQAPRVGFGRGLPEHDPWRFDAARLAASGEADAALWLASLPCERPGWLGRLRTVALLGEGAAAPDVAEIVIAVAVPGEGVGGTLWDEGRAAIAYRPAAGTSALPAAAGVIEAIRRGLASKEAA
ncbi:MULTISPECIES: formyltransferase [Methylobacterium]|uniref:Formyltransferase/hydrolase complex Fhc subunit B n=1 Tax=Methylobacterium jeotgali TaxID=381630 RepID=A0ABQ4SUR6_9HYPH|nr:MULTISPECIES: formyltransferase [Methylobacterium]PIU07882.1 MAG: formyltransferase [Methylobacterium sp. CG09_land_8_20_14_0_10_71_15]PIU13139.1 MAG: formyltransferase [Methylobacterium sp. CG08_land_8_20_14_0_20_71_15]GJE05613.1 Formyltransferase/hydrolase complex Fhc subunit B [Methylobacterium jeotgali]